MTSFLSQIRHTVSDHLFMKGILVFFLGVTIGASGAYSAVLESSVMDLVSLVKTQCNQDKACITEVAGGLERAANTLLEVATSLRAEMKSPSDYPDNSLPPSPAGTTGSPTGTIGGSPSTTPVPSSGPTGSSTTPAGTRNDPTGLLPNMHPAVADLLPWTASDEIKCTYNLTGAPSTYFSTTYQCMEALVYCHGATATIMSNLGSIEKLQLEQTTEGVINFVKYPEYLGKSQQDCKTALEHITALRIAEVYE